jgi:hypothetical protein
VTTHAGFREEGFHVRREIGRRIRSGGRSHDCDGHEESNHDELTAFEGETLTLPDGREKTRLIDGVRELAGSVSGLRPSII